MGPNNRKMGLPSLESEEEYRKSRRPFRCDMSLDRSYSRIDGLLHPWVKCIVEMLT